MTIRLPLTTLATALLLTPLASALAAPADDAKQIAAANNQFASDLYATLAPADGNLFFSPYSISSALAMTSAGARGNTQTQMNKTLHLDLPDLRLHPAFASLTNTFNKDGQYRLEPSYPPAFQLVVANAIWGQQTYPFIPDFQNLLKTNYNSEVHSLDFAAATEPSRLTINKWVADQTKDKIQNLIPQGAITSVTRLVLTNAIYFKSNWQDKFQKTATTDQPFHLSPTQTATVPMMCEMRSYAFLDTPNAHIVELPYTMNRLSMVLIVPKDVAGLPQVEKDLPANLDKWLSSLRSRRVDLSLPRFKTTSSFSLNKQLQALGITDAFDPAKADFSAMTSAEKLYISDVIHKAYVDVNEEGTEAAAATAVMMAGGAMPPRDEPVVVKADRPFLFLIRHSASNTILFLGRLQTPGASPEPAPQPANPRAGRNPGPTPATPPVATPTVVRPPTRANPAPINGRPANPNAPTNTLIVMLAPNVDIRAEVARLETTYNFRATYTYTSIHGFAAPLTNDQIQKLRNEPSILQMEYDQVIRLNPPGGPQ